MSSSLTTPTLWNILLSRNWLVGTVISEYFQRRYVILDLVRVPAQEKKNRYLVFDLMRGFFMFGIIVNHLALYPNLLAIFTGATKLWVSFAEGFFMVSGFLIGALNKEKIKQGFGGVFRKMSVRSLRLYLWTVYLTILFTYWGNLMPLGSVKESLWIVNQSNLPELILKTITLEYTYGWADILPYYAAFLLVSPLYLWGLQRGWVAILLGLNLLVWIFRGNSIYLAIQALFFLGVVAGFYSDKIRSTWASWSTQKKHKTKTILYGVFLMSLFASIFSVFFFEKVANQLGIPAFLISKNRVLNLYFDKQTVGLGRLLLAPLWFSAGVFLFNSFIKEIEKYLGWLFLTFGKNSLYAYILHAFVIYPIPFWVGYYSLNGIWWNTIISLGTVVIIYALLAYSAHAFKRKF